MKTFYYLAFSTLLLATGCKSAGMFGGLTRDDRDQPSTYATDTGSRAAGLPPASQGRPTAATVDQQVSLGQSEISSWYQDKVPSRLDTARRHFEEALRQDPAHVNAHHGMAIAADLQERFAEAAQHYRQALAGSPNNSQILGDFGYSYLLQNKLSESEQLLQQALVKDPNNANAIKHLGDVYARQGKADLAESTYRKVLNDADVKRALAENTPQGAGGLASSSNATETRPLLNRLRPNPNRNEDLTAQIKQKMDEERVADELRRRQQEESAELAEMRSSPSERPAWADGSAQSPYTQAPAGTPVSSPGPPSDGAALKRQLAQIDREPTRNIPQGPVIIDGPRGELQAIPGAATPVPWPGDNAPPTAAGPAEGSDRSPPQVRDNSPDLAHSSNPPPPTWAQGESYPDRNGIEPDPVTRPWGSVPPSTTLASASSNSPESVDRAYYEQAHDRPGPRYADWPEQSSSGLGTRSGPDQASAPAVSQTSASQVGMGQTGPGSYEEAARAAARLGMGLGGGTMFAVPQQTTPRTSPGSSSVWNGAAMTPPARVLPTDVPPQDLSRAYQPQAAANMAPTAGSHGQYPAVTPPLRNTDQFGTASRYQPDGYPSEYPRNTPSSPSLQPYEVQRNTVDGQLNAAMSQAWGNSPQNAVTPAGAEVPVQGTTITPKPWPYRAEAAEAGQADPRLLNRSTGGQPQRLQPSQPSYPAGVVVPKPYPSSPAADGRVGNTEQFNTGPSSSGPSSGTRPPAGSGPSSASSGGSSYGLPQIIPGR